MNRLTIAALIVLAAGAAQPAQALQSCSDYKGVCMVKAVNKSLCDGAWKKCMRTGIYIGPESGTNHGQAEKR